MTDGNGPLAHVWRANGPDMGSFWQALQEQIQTDFKKVTGYGNKAGYVPPVKMPHM